MLSLTSLIPLIPLLSTLVQSVEAFDYRSAIQGKTNRGDVPGRYVLEFDTSNDAKQVAKRDGGVSRWFRNPVSVAVSRRYSDDANV